MSLADLNREQPFSYRSIKGGSVQIAYNGKLVTTVSGRDAARFLARVAASRGENAQLLMAKVTGHFKHGTERSVKPGRS